MQTAVIDAGMLQLALATRKMGRPCRWAAMSAHIVTAQCRQRTGRSWSLPQKSVAVPMDRGDLKQVVSRVNSQGRREVIKTFGCGIRAIKADVACHFLGA